MWKTRKNRVSKLICVRRGFLRSLSDLGGLGRLFRYLKFGRSENKKWS